MKNFLPFLLIIALLFSCKKKNDPEPEPEPVKTGTIVVNTLAYDSAGNTMGDKSGFRVLLNPGLSYTTGSSGAVRFENITYGNYFPDVFRNGWDAPITLVNLNAPEVNVTVPVAQRSAYEIINFSGQGYDKDSILISFDLKQPVPSGQLVRVAVITGSSSAVKESDFLSVDIIQVAGNVQSFNIAKLQDLQNAVAGFATNANFFINVLPVSYGKYISNAQTKPIILGENLKMATAVPIQKTWK